MSAPSDGGTDHHFLSLPSHVQLICASSGISAAPHETFLFDAFEMMAWVGCFPKSRLSDAAILLTTHLIILG